MANLTSFEQALEQQLIHRLKEIKRDFKHTRTLTQASPLPEKSYDLLVVPTSIVSTETLKPTLKNYGKALMGDGLLLAHIWGSNNLPEFKTFNLSSKARPHMKEIGDTLTQLHFALPVVESSMTTLTFSSLEKMSSHLKQWQMIDENLPPELEEAWRETYPHPKGYLPLTMEKLTITAWRPHQSQQQPLKPGKYHVKIGTLPEPKEPTSSTL